MTTANITSAARKIAHVGQDPALANVDTSFRNPNLYSAMIGGAHRCFANTTFEAASVAAAEKHARQWARQQTGIPKMHTVEIADNFGNRWDLHI